MTMTDSIFTAVITGLVSGTGVAVLNYALSKNKTKAEIQKMEAEAQKMRAETEKVLIEVRNLSANLSYNLAASAEEILFDGRGHFDGFDVKGQEGQFWAGVGANALPTSPKGQGELKVEDGGILNLRRNNVEGRFELIFQRYAYKGKEHLTIPKDELIAGKRKLRVTCEAKVVGGEHTIRFVIREPSAGRRLAQEKCRVTTNEWTPFQVFLPVDATVNCQLRLDDEEVSFSPSSVQIRNIVIAQRN